MSEINKIGVILNVISLVVLILGLFLPMIGSSPAYCVDCEEYDMNIHEIADKDEIGKYGPYEDPKPRIWLILGFITSIIAFAFYNSSNFEDFRKMAPVASIIAGIFAFLAFFAVLTVFNDVNEGGRNSGAPYDVAQMMWASWALLGSGVFGIIGGLVDINKNKN